MNRRDRYPDRKSQLQRALGYNTTGKSAAAYGGHGRLLGSGDPGTEWYELSTRVPGDQGEEEHSRQRE